MKADVEQKLELLVGRFPVLVGGSVPHSEIDQAEKLIGVKFDPDYRWFVGKYGAAMVGSLPVLGLRRAEVMGDDLYSVVEVTLRFRSDGWEPTREWVVISVDAAGNPIGIADDGRVWLADHNSGRVEPIAENFQAYLLRLLDEVES